MDNKHSIRIKGPDGRSIKEINFEPNRDESLYILGNKSLTRHFIDNIKEKLTGEEENIQSNVITKEKKDPTISKKNIKNNPQQMKSAFRPPEQSVFLGIAKLLTKGKIPPEFLIKNYDTETVGKTDIKGLGLTETPDGKVIYKTESEEDKIIRLTEKDDPGVRRATHICYIDRGGEAALIETTHSEYVIDLMMQSDQRNLKNISAVTSPNELSLLKEDKSNANIPGHYGVPRRNLYNVRLSLPGNGNLPDDNYLYFVYWLGTRESLEGIEWWNKEYVDRIYAIPQLVPGSGAKKVKKEPTLNKSGNIDSGRTSVDWGPFRFSACRIFNRKKNNKRSDEILYEDILQPDRITIYPLSAGHTPDPTSTPSRAATPARSKATPKTTLRAGSPAAST